MKMANTANWLKPIVALTIFLSPVSQADILQTGVALPDCTLQQLKDKRLVNLAEVQKEEAKKTVIHIFASW